GAERDRIRVIYNGVDPVSFSPRRVSRPSAPTVVSIARIDPLKDLETFLRVADLVRQHIPRVQFLHYGPVADREYDKTVKALHRDLNLGNTVKFMGTTDNPAEAYNQADVVLLTSISEAFPYSVVESLMCGKPVVSTDVGGVREALEGVGLLARPKDIEGLADATLRLLNLGAPARQELEAACRDRALNRFTIDAVLDGYRRTYVTLAEAYRRERAAGRIPKPQPVLKPQLTVVAETPEVETAIPTVDERQDVIIVDQGLSAPPAEIREEIERQRMMPPEEIEVVSDAGDIGYAPEGDAGIPEPMSPMIEPEHDFEVRELQPTVGVSLNSDDPRERSAAFEEAYRRGGAEFSEAVRTLLADPDPEIRRRAIAPAATAEALPRTESIHLLSQVLSSDPDPTVRSAAAAALAAVLAREES
ncbi:MAG: glycosyltransferase, partial [Actinomycetota bacterium]